MLEICSINEKMLPEIKCSFESCGKVKKEICTLLGWGEVVVAPGAGDNAGAAIGMGVVGDGMCSISLGTSGTVFIAGDKFKIDPDNALHSFAHADGNYHLMGCMLSAASCNKWFLEDVLKSHDYGECEKICPDGKNKVYFLPYLMGERSPHNDAYLRGAFAGMSMDTKRSDMIKAVLEGVCYGLRDSLSVARNEGSVTDSVRVCGGGAKSDVWCKMLANILRVRVVKTNCTEGPSFGACILAMTACGEYESVKAATESIVKIESEISYDEEAAARYDKGYEKFKKLHLSLKDWFRDE